MSYDYIAGRLADYDPKAASGRTVVLHLGSGVSAWVIPTNEEIMIARHTLDVIGG